MTFLQTISIQLISLLLIVISGFIVQDIFFNTHIISTAYAAMDTTEEHHEEASHGVPTVVFYQVLNFLLFIGLLFYLLRDKVKTFYQNRYNQFQEKFEASKKERETMEATHKDYQKKLQNITKTEKVQIQKAEQEANAMKARMLSDADLENQRITQQAQLFLELEHKKLKRQMQIEFSRHLITQIRSEIAKDINSEDQKALVQKFTKQVSLQ